MARGRKPAKLTAQTKRKLKRENSIGSTTKTEREEPMSDFPIYPGFFDPGQDILGQDRFLLGADSLSLKGQVWPGMGKMDLANDEMKRTRNQRKPKSVIDKMKRSSEGIVPTSVVMTPDFKVERVKGVYDDSSSPIPGQEESTPPRKVSKPRRKKRTPLTEVSKNVPRQRRSITSVVKAQNGKKSEVSSPFGHHEAPGTNSSLGHFRHGHDVFRDDDVHFSSFGGQPLPSSRNDRRFDLRDRHATRSMSTIPHSNLVSPTPQSKELPPRHFTARDGNNSLRPESFPPGSFGHIEASYAMKDATIYNASSRLPFTPSTHNHFHGIDQDLFRSSSTNAFHIKQEDFSGSIGDSTQGTNGSPFVGMTGTNPLFTQDRLFLGSYNQGTPNTSLSTLSFSPINRQREHLHGTREFKPQTHLCEMMNRNDLCNEKDSDLSGPWNLHHSNHNLDFPDGLATDDPQI
ncbi:hypothetical protein FZEAL_8151 [Fusarium zealandicum]|uniref:Uncharacterized protein n=1 Tax=Fusarium zealandicum TaxID=1053134 RepID=A0A8H4XH59_9HYPO|nr:hypothetical protein FZEAL_8151 [Fusarium zealandicum]